MPPENQNPVPPPVAPPAPKPAMPTPPPPMPQRPNTTLVEPPPKPPHHSQVPLIGTAVLLIILVAGLGWYFFYSKSTFIGTKDMRVSMVEDGALSWYSIQKDIATKVKGPAGFTAATVRFATPTLANGDTPVVIDSDKGSATVLGVIRKDGTVRQVVFDGVPKYELAGRPDGRAVYSAYRETTDHGIKVGEWRLSAASVEGVSPLPLDLGPGFSSVFLSDGALLAITPNGVARVNPDRGGLTLIIARPLQYGIASISPDAQYVILPNSVTNALDVFSISNNSVVSASYIGSIKTSALAASFISPTSFMVKIDVATLVEYTITNGTITPVSTITIHKP